MPTRPSRRMRKPCVRLESWPLVKCPSCGRVHEYVEDHYHSRVIAKYLQRQFEIVLFAGTGSLNEIMRNGFPERLIGSIRR
jgi:hypothetical protein